MKQPFITSTFILLYLTVFAGMVFIDFYPATRDSGAWFLHEGINILIGLAAFTAALLSLGWSLRNININFGMVAISTLGVAFGVVGYIIARFTYHAAWHPDKEWHTLLLILCSMIGGAAAGLYAIAQIILSVVTRVKTEQDAAANP